MESWNDLLALYSRAISSTVQPSPGSRVMDSCTLSRVEATMPVESWTGEGDIATTQAEIAVIIKEVIKYFIMVFKF